MKSAKKSKIIKEKLKNSCVQRLIPEIKEQTKSKNKRHNSGTFSVSLKFFQNSLCNNSRIQTISAKTPSTMMVQQRAEQTWPFFAIQHKSEY
jgi:nucleotidyltransferase/DNA polymerase involved in DNA repair